MAYKLTLLRHDDGSVELVGEAPKRIRVTQDLLDNADPAVVSLDADGGVMLTLTNAVLWYRRVEFGDGWVEFERVA